MVCELHFIKAVTKKGWGRGKTIKLLEENIGINVHDLGLGNCFLDMTPEAEQRRKRKDKLYFVITKNFCASKGTIKKVKRQPTE